MLENVFFFFDLDLPNYTSQGINKAAMLTYL